MMRMRLSEADVLDLAEEALNELMPAMETATQQAAALVVEEAKLNLRKRQGTRRTASPANEPPEYDEGNLVRSLTVFRTRRTKYSVRTEYGSEAEHAGLHEFGGTITYRGKTRTYPPRPYVRPAEASTERQVERILEGVL